MPLSCGITNTRPIIPIVSVFVAYSFLRHSFFFFLRHRFWREGRQCRLRQAPGKGNDQRDNPSFPRDKTDVIWCSKAKVKREKSYRLLVCDYEHARPLQTRFVWNIYPQAKRWQERKPIRRRANTSCPRNGISKNSNIIGFMNTTHLNRDITRTRYIPDAYIKIFVSHGIWLQLSEGIEIDNRMCICIAPQHTLGHKVYNV